ncbi:hypothetical protein AAVH_03269 [Aphelenchoides avenae]|nr:hypothetical protein AAVH_03269 [Aphelenchus avenae]
MVLCAGKTKKHSASASPPPTEPKIVTSKEGQTDTTEPKKSSDTKPEESNKEKKKEQKPMSKPNPKPAKKQRSEEKAESSNYQDAQTPAPPPNERSNDEKFAWTQKSTKKVVKKKVAPQSTEPRSSDGNVAKAAGPTQPNAVEGQYANLDILDDKKPPSREPIQAKTPAKNVKTAKPTNSVREGHPPKAVPNEDDDAFTKKIERSEMKSEAVPESQYA